MVDNPALAAASHNDREAGAPEITLQMTRAGISALRNWIPADPERYSGSDAQVVRDVFLAMDRFLRSKPHQ